MQTLSSDAIVDSQNDYPEYAGPLTLDALIEEVERRREEFDAISHVPRDMVDRKSVV